MEKYKFISIGKTIFVPTSSVKMLIDAKADVSKAYIKSAKLADKILNVVPKNEMRVSLVLMDDDALYLTRYRADTISDRMRAVGCFTLKIAPGIYIPVDNIKGVYGFSTTLATKLRKSHKDDTNISLVRGTKRRKSTIVLKTGEFLNVAYPPEVLMASIEKVTPTSDALLLGE